MKRLYFRCNGGHYFSDPRGCPYDGWSIDGLHDLAHRFAELESEGIAPTLNLLEDGAGPSNELRNRMVIIEFGDPEVAFEALVPERYTYKDRDVLLHETGTVLK